MTFSERAVERVAQMMRPHLWAMPENRVGVGVEGARRRARSRAREVLLAVEADAEAAGEATVRLTPGLVEAVDAARGDVPREQWVQAVVALAVRKPEPLTTATLASAPAGGEADG